MTDELEKRFEDLRRRTLGEIVAPGAPAVRSTVRRRRGAAVSAGAGFAVAAVLIGAGVGLYPGGGDYVPGTTGDAPPGPGVLGGPGVPSGGVPSGRVPFSAGPPVMPEPTGPEYDRAQAAADLLEDRALTPISVNATAGVVTGDYRNDMNDMPADTYTFHFYCVGAGEVGVVVKQGDSGDTVLGQGAAACAASDPAPLTLTIRQPAYGYLRVFATGDARSNGQAGFALEFLSTTGQTGFGPSGPPYSFPPSAPN